MNILILHDHVPADAPPDAQDGLAQVAAVDAALRASGHRVSRLACTLDLASLEATLTRNPPDLVFNLVETLASRGRLCPLVPLLLESLAIPFTGNASAPTFITANKLTAKRLMRASNLPTADWIELDPSRRAVATHTVGGAVGGGAFPKSASWIVKSVWEHASIGLDEDSVVSVATREALEAEVRRRLPALGGEGFAEKFIDGREFNLSLIEAAGTPGVPEILPPAEMVFEGYGENKPKVIGYRAKWDESSEEYHRTVRTFEFGREDAALLERLRGVARRAWEVFGLSGYARVDIRIDQRNEPWILEVNTNPCIAPDAGFAAALGRAGIAYPDAVARIVSAAMGRATAPHTG
jgi:D-alanine-D-alanine ligase